MPQIFAQVAPLDLLHMARATKGLRSILMNRQAIGVWKDALSAIEGLPECPTEMSLVAWTALAFESRCTVRL